MGSASDVFIMLGLIIVPILIALVIGKARTNPIAGKILCFASEIVEAVVVYIILKVILHLLGASLPPIGSGVFLLFVILWPSLLSPFLRPGFQTSP
ncbi:hypothetical protein ACFL2Q_13225 [Thermodesulfobacteriota bacterium]